YSVARWDGSSWDTLGSRISGCVGGLCVPGVFNLLVQGTELYAVGAFTSIGGVAANAAAKWDGMGWVPWGTGFGGTNVNVSGLVMHNAQIYASGSFQTAGGMPAQNMAVWNGSDWEPFSGANRNVQRILSDGSSLYAAGDFTTIGGTPANRVARWDGSWTPLGTGVTSDIFDAVLTGIDLLVSGQFVQAGSAPAITVARWDGLQWSALNVGHQNGMNLPLGVVRALHVYDESLYAGGDFNGAGPEIRSRIARWDGNSWLALGSGIIGPSGHRVRAITDRAGSIYAGGTFTNAGGVIASNIACWNGANWSALGVGVNSNVHALAADDDYVYAGGAFTRAGGSPANRFAWWDGVSWSTLGSGANSNVNALLVWNGRLIVGGQFTSVSGFPINKLAEFTPFMALPWRPVGPDVFPPGGNVLALAANGTDLYVAGNFVIPAISATNVVKWDGASWSAVGNGLLGRTTAPINALALRGHELFAAGTLTNASGLPVQAIAKWDGTNWHALGSGVQMIPSNPTVSALAVYDNALFVGGLFNRSGGRPSVCIARWIADIPLQIVGLSYTLDEFRLQAQTVPGLKLRLDGSSDLNTWTALYRRDSYSEMAELIDPAPPSDRRIYRVVAEP
ncbi:MAG: hypothetical protein L0Y72_06180, partial [Gemmataceae bacterium]|nr:hypothetical protein [Gemmataceae bacterium]